MSDSSLLGDLIDLDEALEADRHVDLEVRKRRDRTLGQKLQHERNRPVVQLRTWLQQMRRPTGRHPGSQGTRLYHTLCLILVVAGLLAGWGLTSAVLFYDGSHPINIVNAVAVLVLPQMLLLLVWLLAAIPVRLPIFGQMSTALGFLNPGRLTGHLAGTVSANSSRGLAMLWSPDNIATLAPAARWLFSLWSQLFAFSFNIGILACAFFLISSSDLAFAWSTTLSISDETLHRFLAILSAPWSTVAPEAVPAAELVANSRYYRFDEGALAGAAATPQLVRQLGQWWPFLIAAVSCYGLLPRLATLVVSWYRFRRHLRVAICNLAGAPELLARMNSPLVSTLAPEPEQASGNIQDHAPGRVTVPHSPLRGPLIDWSGACERLDEVAARLEALGIEAQALHRAGGRRTTEQDHELVASLCRGKPAGVSIVVKSWEPPILDFLDMLRDIRAQCGEKTPLIVLLRGEGDGVSKLDLETWQLTVAQLGDPNLYIESLGQTL